MSLLEAIRVAFEGVTANKLRAFLTTLGVVIGVGAVIALVSVSEGASAMISSQIEGLGTNLIVITPNNTRVVFTAKEADMLADRVESLDAVAPSLSARAKVKWGINNHDTTLEGVVPAHLDVRNYSIAAGRFLDAGDVSWNRRVAVIGHTVLDKLFANRDPVGQELIINGQQFVVIGVLAEKGESFVQNQDDVVLVPVSSAQRLAGTSNLTAIYARLDSGDLAPTTVAQIRRIFERHYGRADQVRVQSQDELLGTVSSMTRTVSLMLGAIAGISLVVGGIGIMNIMLVSVTERTREIGLRKAVGARRADIMSQFLIESIFISLLGGAVGIALGSLLAAGVARFGGWEQGVSPSSVVLSFGFAAAVGIIFGLYPAMRAAALDPIKCLRYE